MSTLLLLLLPSTPVLEAELDSQTREDDELPPASILPYAPRVQRILTDYWLATGGKGSTAPRR